MGRVGPLVFRARFGNDKRKFQFDFGGPCTPGHPPGGPNKLDFLGSKTIGTTENREKSMFFGGFAGLRPWNRPKLARGWAPGKGGMLGLSVGGWVGLGGRAGPIWD